MFIECPHSPFFLTMVISDDVTGDVQVHIAEVNGDGAQVD